MDEKEDGRTDYLGEGAVVTFDVARHALGFDERRAEEDERVGWARDVAGPAFLSMRRLRGGDARDVFLGYELEARSLFGSYFDVWRVRTVRDGGKV